MAWQPDGNHWVYQAEHLCGDCVVVVCQHIHDRHAIDPEHPHHIPAPINFEDSMQWPHGPEPIESVMEICRDCGMALAPFPGTQH